jgi:hypothetical protein
VGCVLEYENIRSTFQYTVQGLSPGEGSSRQVAAGLHAALWTVIEERLENVYFVEDLL